RPLFSDIRSRIPTRGQIQSQTHQKKEPPHFPGSSSIILSYLETFRNPLGAGDENFTTFPVRGCSKAMVVACKPSRFSGFVRAPYFLSPATGCPISSI